MFKKWFVVRITLNTEGNASKNIDMYDTEKMATDKFYDELAQYGGNDKVAVVRMLLLNDEGMQIKDITRDNRVIAQPQTEEVTA